MFLTLPGSFHRTWTYRPRCDLGLHTLNPKPFNLPRRGPGNATDPMLGCPFFVPGFSSRSALYLTRRLKRLSSNLALWPDLRDLLFQLIFGVAGCLITLLQARPAHHAPRGICVTRGQNLVPLGSLECSLSRHPAASRSTSMKLSPVNPVVDDHIGFCPFPFQPRYLPLLSSALRTWRPLQFRDVILDAHHPFSSSRTDPSSNLRYPSPCLITSANWDCILVTAAL